MSIGVAIIGAGIFAKEEHVPAVEASDVLLLRAIYSRSSKTAKSLAALTSDVDIYSEDSGSGKGYQDLLKRPDIHAVIIALPIKNQPEYIRAALSAGKHVLSEKPVAENVAEAVELIKWYHSNVDTSKTTWSVGENYRYLTSFDHAREQVQKLGRVLGFRVKLYASVQPGSKYYGRAMNMTSMIKLTDEIETEWRKSPTHQGGFLLDGGVHSTAGIRLLLGSANAIARLSAFTVQLQKHLPPVDTVDATLKTKTDTTGTFSVSFGTSLTGSEWTVACEGGSVSVSRSTVTTTIDGQEESKEIGDERTGVPPEVRHWAEAIESGTQNEKQKPEEALADLELLESMLRSGDSNGEPQDLIWQI